MYSKLTWAILWFIEFDSWHINWFIVSELMYLQWLDPKEPVYIYINSTGTTRDYGETVSFLTLCEWFKIFFLSICTIFFLSICTILKCLKRYVAAMIQQPRVPSSGLMAASDVLIRAKNVCYSLCTHCILEI